MEVIHEIQSIPNEQNNTINSKSTNLKDNINEIAKNQKAIKNNIAVIPLKETYSLGYAQNTNTYDNLSDNIKNIINDPKYNDDKRSKSAYSKKSFREKFESMKLKVPEIKKWNCDPTAEIIIHNLELKIDILAYENNLLTKKIKELVNNNKELQLSLNQNILLLKTEQQLNDDKYKVNENRNNLKNNKKKDNKNKEKDVDLFKQIKELKDENIKLKKSNENLAGNNMELNKIINELKNEMLSNNNKYEEELENKRLLFEKQLSEQNEKFNEYINNNNNNNNINSNNISNSLDKDNNINNINNNNEGNELHNNNNNNYSSFDINKYMMNEEQYRQLLKENEQLHKKLRMLLSIEEDDINKQSAYLQDQDNNKNYEMKNDLYNSNDNNLNNNLNNINNNNNNFLSEDLMKENYLLKQKIKSLNNELKTVTFENNQKLLKIQEKLNEREMKNKIEMKNNKNNNIDINENENDEDKREELDRIINDTLMNINDEDEESKKMISTIKSIKNGDKKRISQCLIINNKIKSLIEENNLLRSQLISMKKGNKLNNNINDIQVPNNNLNNTPTPNNNINNIPIPNTNICLCGSKTSESYDYLINALKIKDEIIIKYKEQSEDNENKYKELIIENSKLKDSNKFNTMDNDYKDKDIGCRTRKNIKRERADGLEDYLLDKIVNNQKQVLGERAPRFEENNYKFMSKSFQCQDNNLTMNNRYNNNYHYRGTRMSNYE